MTATANTGKATLEDALDLCIKKIHTNIADIAAQTVPTTWALAVDGDYTKWKESFYEIGNWTIGFFTGMAVLAWKKTGDDFFLKQLEALKPRMESKLEGENGMNTMHDIGFLFSPYAVALYKLTGEKQYRDLGIKAADLLVTRFIDNGSYFRAWGRMDEIGTDYDGLAIIDCLMNMPLLHWASEVTGDSNYRELAIRHTDTTLANFVREDWSVSHSYRFDAQTGAPTGQDNYCGHHPDSQWARGTTWAMYGFALAYSYTGDERYLNASINITRKFLAQLDDEIVPIWDFRLSEGYPDVRDASAASVAVCAIQKLLELGHADEAMIASKNDLLDRLVSPEYLDSDLSVRGLQKKGEVGDGHDADRHFYKGKHAYTSWGDYYLMEGLAQELGQKVNWW